MTFSKSLAAIGLLATAAWPISAGHANSTPSVVVVGQTEKNTNEKSLLEAASNTVDVVVTYVAETGSSLASYLNGLLGISSGTSGLGLLGNFTVSNTPPSLTGTSPTAPAPAEPVEPAEPTASPLYANPGVISGSGKTYYVDYDAGNDGNAGTSPAAPWKHAPGDLSATGTPAKQVLAAGDTVRFKGGVRYRGAIRLKYSGTVQQPIIYTGTGYGTGQAIFDGADDVTKQVRCPSAAACGGASNYSKLRLVTYAEPVTKNLKFYDQSGQLHEVQTPALNDPFWDDDLDQFAVIPVAQAGALQNGRLENAQLAEAARGQVNARLAIWVYGNWVKEVKITSVSGNVIHFEVGDNKIYTDRDTKAAIVGSVKALTKPGMYARLADGQAVVYPRNSNSLDFSVGSGRVLIDARGQSNIIVHGIKFVNGTGGTGKVNEGGGIRNSGKALSNLQILGNRFEDFSLKGGYGAIQLSNITDLVVRGNFVRGVATGSGIRLGANTNALVEKNYVTRFGRTGIYLANAIGANVRNNIVTDAMSAHGNAMTFYLANQNVKVESNCVFDSTRPLTFHGSNESGPYNNLVFRRNIFVTKDGTAAMSAWGRSLKGLTIEENLAIGTRRGVLLNAGDKDVKVVNNRFSGISINGSKTTPAGWTISDNDLSGTTADIDNMDLSEQSCSAMMGKIALKASTL